VERRLHSPEAVTTERRRTEAVDSATLAENVDVIKTWEREQLNTRTRAEQVSDWITSRVTSGPVVVLHLIVYGAWIAINAGALPHVRPFDRYPFFLLTTVVSLEVIFLTLFVLASQNRLSRQAEKRAHLDLQINLLTEREMTAVLRLLRDIARHLDVKEMVPPDQIQDLAGHTDIEHLTKRIEEFDAKLR
jgi:uncharacterized membrane protein